MALAYLFDENLRGALWSAIQHHNLSGGDALDVMRVGDPPAPALGTSDADILLWGELHGRILVTLDRRTMQSHLDTHLMLGRHSPGVFALRPGWPAQQIIDALLLHHLAGDPQHYVDVITFIP